jgi:hypothetical protein
MNNTEFLLYAGNEIDLLSVTHIASVVIFAPCALRPPKPLLEDVFLSGVFHLLVEDG